MQLIRCTFVRNDHDQVRRSVELRVPPATVWEAITDPAAAGAWFGERLDVDTRPGGRVTVGDGPGMRRGTVEHVDPPRRLTLRVWDPPDAGAGLQGSRIDFSLDPIDDGGTRLTVTETRLTTGARLLAGSSVA